MVLAPLSALFIWDVSRPSGYVSLGLGLLVWGCTAKGSSLLIHLQAP